VIVDVGSLSFEWIDGWGRDGYLDPTCTTWAHHGLTCTPRGDVVVSEPNSGRLLVFDASGEMRCSVSTELTQPHFMRCVPGATDEMWIADVSVRLHRGSDGSYTPDWSAGGRVTRVRLSDGEIQQQLPTPDHLAYSSVRYSPTGVDIDDDSMWVADGYGASLVHRFNKDGDLTLTLDGETEGAGRFDCPHACVVDRRRSRLEVYVADRANARLVVFDREGCFLRIVGAEYLLKPSALAVWEDLLFVADLRGRLSVLDIDDRLVGHLGEKPSIATLAPGFPNELGPEGNLVRPAALSVGRFQAPHDVAVDARGNVYVTEYVIGGRLTKLQRLRA
jgi:hypothetical protein